MSVSPLAYRYAHVATEATTGYFSCEPPDDLDLEDGLDRLRLSPNDTFLHRYLLGRLRERPLSEKKTLLRSSNPAWAALAAESLLLHESAESRHSGEASVSSGEL